MDPWITLPSHGSCCPSRGHALQEVSQYAQQSEALEPSDTDDDLAPDTRSLSNPVTPTKPSSRENQTLANAPKKIQKLTRKFSEADLQDSTPSKRPRFFTCPSIASRSLEIATVEQDRSQPPLPTSLRPARHTNEGTSRMSMQVEKYSRSQPYNKYNFVGSIEAGMERMQITSSHTSEDEYVYIHNCQNSSEAEIKRTETASSLGSDDEAIFGDDEFSTEEIEATVGR